MCVCFFLWGFRSYSRTFQAYEDVTITGERLQIFTYARHLWPLRSEGSSVYHAYCYGLMIIFEDPW